MQGSTGEVQGQIKKARVSGLIERGTAAIQAELQGGTTGEATTHADFATHMQKTGVDAGTQPEETANDIYYLRTELNNAYGTIRTFKDDINRLLPFTESCVQTQSRDFIQRYTGLPNFDVLKAIFDFVVPKESLGNTKLTAFQEFMLTLQKLQNNTSSKDLAYRFDVHPSTISRILLKWLTIMNIQLKFLIIWPERENLRKTMPGCFRAEFGDKVATVIDCFEVFMERPSNLLARSCTWSNYKYHNTVKLLIGITPQGVVSFISDAWGGRASDKFLTEALWYSELSITRRYCSCRPWFRHRRLSWYAAGSPSYSCVYKGKIPVVCLGSRTNAFNRKCAYTCRTSNWLCSSEVYDTSSH